MAALAGLSEGAPAHSEALVMFITSRLPVSSAQYREALWYRTCRAFRDQAVERTTIDFALDILTAAAYFVRQFGDSEG
jgi:hypothetical protein